MQDPELQRRMLDECLEDELRAGVEKAMELMRDFDVAGEIPVSSVAGGELHGVVFTLLGSTDGEGLKRGAGFALLTTCG